MPDIDFGTDRDQVQAKLTENRQGESRAARSSTSCLFAGLLFDDRGHLISLSHARKADGRRYRYYVSQAVLQGHAESAGTIRRVSADEIESLVERNVCRGLPKEYGKCGMEEFLETKAVLGFKAA